MPNWLSYRGEGCSLSFHMPPVFQGLVVCFVNPLGTASGYFNFIIRNKSNGIQLLQSKIYLYAMGRIIYFSRSEMAMEDYCGDDELELEYSKECECGVHVITGKSDSFEELEVGRDKVMPSPPPYHLLPHPHCGSITASTLKQWSDFLFAELQNYNLRFYG